jgi:hypothetical protein
MLQNACRKTPSEETNWRDLRVYGKIILKQILEKCGVKEETGINWHRTESNGGLS